MSLEEFLQTVKDIREYKRGQAIKLDLEGYPRKFTAEVLSVSVSFVSKWRLQYNEHGAEGLRLSYQGSKGYFQEAEKQQVLDWISEQSPYLSRETLETYLEAEYGVRFKSRRSYYDLLEQAGLSYKKRQGVNPAKDEQQVGQQREVLKKVLDHQAQIEAGEIVVVMADECHLLWGDAEGYGWGKKSERLLTQIGNPKARQSYFGAVNAQSGELLLAEAQNANSETTIAFLAQLQGQYQGKKLWVIWDNASYHKSDLIKEYLQQINGTLPKKDWPLTLLNFAPNAPEQNPIEAVWLQGKNNIRKQTGLDSFQQVTQFFVNSLTENTYHFDEFKWYGFSLGD